MAGNNFCESSFCVMPRFTQWSIFSHLIKMRYFPIQPHAVLFWPHKQTKWSSFISFCLEPVWLHRPENLTTNASFVAYAWHVTISLALPNYGINFTVSIETKSQTTPNEMTDPLSGTTLVHGICWHVCCLLTGAAVMLLKPLYSIINKRVFWAPMNRQTLAQLWS